MTRYAKRIVAVCLFCTLALWAVTFDGSKDVTAAGTAEALSATEVRCVWVTVQAKQGNANNVFVGASTVADGRGAELDALDSVTYPPVGKSYFYDLSTIYVDAETNGDGVTFWCERRY